MSESDLVYFIFLCHESQAYRSELEKDHEPDEIYSQMLCAQDMIASRARLIIYDDLHGSKLCFRDFDKYTQSEMLFNAIEYQRTFDKDFKLEYYIDAFIKYYGKPLTLSEVILRAAIRNDVELERVLRKYL